jgi:endonuclease/exonuclease/phosphatase family metal-dependent hydrolase
MLLVIVTLLTLAGLSQSAPTTGPAAPPALRVLSFNIRYDNPDDGDHAWPHRRPLVAQVVRFHGTDLLGAQEALEHQVQQLHADLPGFSWVGVGRGDGKAAGEFAPIFFREDRLELLESGTFWLSPSPDEPGSKGWDAALPRIATWATLRDRAAGNRFLAVNTHFDHVGEQARQESARLVVERATALADDLPIILLGDFNAAPDSRAFETLVAALRDARDVSEAAHFGPDGTFGTFEPRSEPSHRIDYIFVSEGVRVLREATLADHWDGRHASDHWPVFAEVRMPAPGEPAKAPPLPARREPG